ncbi:response regulator [Iodobacter fluviatilis]|uniref:Cyclic di-GMP phosphodiesterase response regulator RpfG n=1 Tax=Iodobacter fluviatilis TaxID=537 RepID=A0A377Q470_9NEIS|nr:two-component system response regulator [Iodobacter fluviatilis]TCU90590.1 putative two-component system response regulator [Iodobacter fluviatilis]STQ89617.1 Cyclic di-GMP phosphodiesterase response regulator RpfG [Iodobacter fluviatilis]
MLDAEFNYRRTILLVDDTPANLAVLNDCLKDTYKLRIANNGEQALILAERDPVPDLVLLDVMMPNMDGIEVCQRLKAKNKTNDIPVIFLTAKTQEADEINGFNAGAVDYIHKPLNPAIVQARVKNHITIQDLKNSIRLYNQTLEERVEQRTQELLKIQDATILAMGVMAELRDEETGLHLKRTQEYLRCLAGAVADHPRFIHQLDPENIAGMAKSAPLHDIGKVGVPDAILHKPAKLTDEEFTIMKNHPTYGRNIIREVERMLGEESVFLRYAREIAYGHQEKWDGSGYPQGAKGDEIPLSARLMAVADVYDALVSKRVYKEAFSHEKSVAIILEGKGKHFDPDLIDGFIKVAGQFQAIALQYADKEEDDLAG